MVASTTSRPSAAPAMEQRLDHLQVPAPIKMHEYQGKRVARGAFCKFMKVSGLFDSNLGLT